MRRFPLFFLTLLTSSTVFAQQFLPVKGIASALLLAALGASTENFVKALDTIDAQYGSLENYLKGPMGLTDEDLRILRERYLVPVR